MYTYKDLLVTNRVMWARLQAEQRTTAPCPFCTSQFVRPESFGCSFFIQCKDCGATGPIVNDYDDPAGLNGTSWVYAMKKSHDKWNGCGRKGA